jgi:hypothetical protein
MSHVYTTDSQGLSRHVVCLQVTVFDQRSEAKRVAVSAFFTLKVLVNFEILSSSKVEVSHVFIVVIKCTL